MADDKLIERKILLMRAFPRNVLYEIGRRLAIPYFERFESGWVVEEEQAALEIAAAVSDEQLRKAFNHHSPRIWAVFMGKHYTLEHGDLILKGAWEDLKRSIRQIRRKHGKKAIEVLRALYKAGDGCSLVELYLGLGGRFNPLPVVNDLERMKVIAVSYKGGEYKEWVIPEEVSPLIQLELGIATSDEAKATGKARPSPPQEEEAEGDYVALEAAEIEKMDGELSNYLADLLRSRLDATIKFGKAFSIRSLADYLMELFGPILYFDSLLSITQQYGLAEAEIVHEAGKTGMRTGWNLALFGEPGTGKSFSTRDMIIGRQTAKIHPHGIPGRNRYAGGMTPARFIRIGQAYIGKVFNFIVPEFNDWFKYKGMVEPLKLAMERGEIKYELHRETIGPYRFGCFFSVNYNVATFGRGYEITIQDPNFNAIEDRMLCRLHRLTKQRFVEIAQSQMKLALGQIDIEKGARSIRDHLTLVYAIETQHPLVRDRWRPKPVLITPEAFKIIGKAREAILNHIPRESVTFSARLEDRAIRFACSASLLNYFQSSSEYIPLSADALNYAIQLYVEEASVRSRQEFTPEEVLKTFSDASAAHA